MIVENCPYASDPRVCNEAKTLVQNGYGVVVICPAKSGECWHTVEEGVTIYRFRDPHFRDHILEYSYALAAIAILMLVAFVRHGFDLIHVANPPDLLVPLCAGWKFFGKRIIYDQHDLCPELYVVKFGGNRLVFRVLLWLEKISYRLADQVIVPNVSYEEIAIRRGGLPQCKLTVVRNGPEVSNLSFGEIDPEIREKASTIIAYAGAIASQMAWITCAGPCTASITHLASTIFIV